VGVTDASAASLKNRVDREAGKQVVSDDGSEVVQGRRGIFKSRRITLDGVMYASVFNPFDGRKNWIDMVTAFCSVFRETSDALLVLKFVHDSNDSAAEMLLSMLYRLQPFKCRVLALRSYLSKEDYEELIKATSYYVNTSHGEGQCLPLMEFMSCGKPAIAPNTSALQDYIDEKVAFVVKSGREPTHWQHDPRRLFRATQSRLDWASLLLAYRESYRVAKEDPSRYDELSRACVSRLQSHCSSEVVKRELTRFLSAAVTRTEALQSPVTDCDSLAKSPDRSTASSPKL